MVQTAWGSLHTALRIEPGDSLLVRGGTTSVGLAAAAIATDKGLTVAATTRKPERRAMLLENGADYVFIETGAISERAREVFPDGVNKVLELVGTTTLIDSLRCTAARGSVCMTGMVGNAWEFDKFSPMGAIPTAVNLTTYSGGAEDFIDTPPQAVIDAIERDAMKLRAGPVFAIDDIVEAHRTMVGNRAAGKIVIVTRGLKRPKRFPGIHDNYQGARGAFGGTLGSRHDHAWARGGSRHLTTISELVAHASDGALAIDGNARIVAWNEAAQELLGYAPEDAIGRACCDVIQAIVPSGEPLCGTDCEGARCFERCVPYSVPACQARHRDGHWVSLNISTIAVPVAPGRGSQDQPMGVILLRAEQSAASDQEFEWPLRVYTFGRFGLVGAGAGIDIAKWPRRHAAILFKYLVAHLGRLVHRERLIEMLWPEADERQGRERLKVTVYALRKGLRAAGVTTDVLETVGQSYGLKKSAIWVDREVYERLINQGSKLERQKQHDEAIRCFEQAQRLYLGNYMSDEPYADWCAEDRERLLEIHLDLLARLSRLYAGRGDYAKAAQSCRTALVHEPCRESFHRTLMEILVRLGRADWAIAQFHRCERLLAEQLGVEPMPETRRLFDDIMAARDQKRARKSGL